MAARMAGIATITKGHLHPMWGPAEAQTFLEFNNAATPSLVVYYAFCEDGWHCQYHKGPPPPNVGTCKGTDSHKYPAIVPSV